MSRVARLRPSLRVIQGDAHCSREVEVRAHFDREAKPCSERDMEILYLHVAGCSTCDALWRQLEAAEERRLEEAETLDGDEEE